MARSPDCSRVKSWLIGHVEAMDRIHRLGQHRPVQVVKLVIEDSIESKIVQVRTIWRHSRVVAEESLQLQEKKAAMVDATLSADDSVGFIDAEMYDKGLTTMTGHGTSHARRCTCNSVLTQESPLIIYVSRLAWLFVQGMCHHPSASRSILTDTL